MKSTLHLMALQSARPDLFDREDARAGLAAVQQAIAQHKTALLGLGALSKSYKMRIARSTERGVLEEYRRDGVPTSPFEEDA